MDKLKQYINDKGNVIGNDILKVDSFLNHQIDVALFDEIGKAFFERFKNKKVDKIVTVEASGIALACFCATHFNNVPVVYAKKDASKIISENSYYCEVYSFTKKVSSNIRIDKDYLNENENILIIDDFLANGQASLGLISLIEQANANVVGLGIVIEKGFQDGRNLLESKGYDVYSLAIIDRFEDGKVIFK